MYDESLFYFAVSLLWRVLVAHAGCSDVDISKFKTVLQENEKAWRQYLICGTMPDQYNDLHIFMTEVGIKLRGVQPVAINNYMARAADCTIASNSQICFVYAKFARFIFFGSVTPNAVQLDHNLSRTRILPSGGLLTTPQIVSNPLIGEFLVDRAASIRSEISKADLSRDPIIEKNVKDKALSILQSDLGRVLEADTNIKIQPGRNERCPCGSGKKFKRCHGREY